MNDGGAGLHVVQGWDVGPHRRLAYYIRHHVPFAHAVGNRLRGRHIHDPRMQMNLYDMTRLFRLIADAGARSMHVDLVRHGDHRGAVLYIGAGS